MAIRRQEMGTNDGYLLAEGWTDDGVSPGRQDQAGIAQIIVASGDISGVAGVIADAFMCLFLSLSLKSVLDDRIRRGSGGGEDVTSSSCPVIRPAVGGMP